jgi:sugar lactone lactonase YvrE
MKSFWGYGGRVLLAAWLAFAALPGSAQAQSAGDPFTQLQDQLAQLSDILAGVSVSEVAADPEGNIYIVVDDNSQVSILEIDPDGNVSDYSGSTLPPDAEPIDVDALLADLLAAANGSGSGPIGTTPADPTSPADPSTTATGTTTPPSSTTGASASFVGSTATPGTSTPVRAAATAAVPTYSFTTPGNQGFSSPEGVAVDAQGNQYVADTDDSMITKVTPFGDVSFLGSGWNGPEAVAVDAAGVVYVVDTGNDRVCKITTAGQVVTIGDSSDFAFPTGVAVDGKGNVYVADPGDHVIDKITPAGVFSLYAGVSQTFGDVDGPALTARFNNPSGVAVDKLGNVYVADSGNSKIRKISAKGVVSTLVSTDGTNSLLTPQGVAVDATGNVFVSDVGNNSIYEITAKGAFLVVGSSGVNAFPSFSDGTADEAEFNQPFGISVDANDNLYVADSTNNVIRIGLLDHPASYLATGSFQVGQQVALNLENAAGTQFIYYAIQSGNAVISGQDSNIVVFQGGGPVKVSTADFTITDGSSGWHGHEIHQGDPGTVPGQPASAAVKKLTQMINPFTPVGAKTFGTGSFTITPPTANDSSGTPVVVSIKSGPATLSGNTVTLTGIGTVVMAADQAAGALYNAAPGNVQQSQQDLQWRVPATHGDDHAVRPGRRVEVWPLRRGADECRHLRGDGHRHQPQLHRQRHGHAGHRQGERDRPRLAADRDLRWQGAPGDGDDDTGDAAGHLYLQRRRHRARPRGHLQCCGYDQEPECAGLRQHDGDDQQGAGHGHRHVRDRSLYRQGRRGEGDDGTGQTGGDVHLQWQQHRADRARNLHRRRHDRRHGLFRHRQRDPDDHADRAAGGHGRGQQHPVRPGHAERDDHAGGFGHDGAVRMRPDQDRAELHARRHVRRREHHGAALDGDDHRAHARHRLLLQRHRDQRRRHEDRSGEVVQDVAVSA